MKRISLRPFDIPCCAVLRSVLFVALVAAAGCGFGPYDGSASPEVTASNDGVPDAGQWWPWACANGGPPAPATTPQSYAVSGTCSDGGTFALSVNGCEMEGNWAVLGLANVSTNIPSRTPSAGGWEVAGTGGPGGDGGVPITCDATESSKVLTVTCSAGDAGVTACVSTLTPVRGS